MSKVERILLALFITVSGPACWEQVSPSWFAQMKDQPALQALEDVEPMVPPAGTIPAGGIAPRIANPYTALFDPGARALANPVPATEASVKRGKEVYGIYCTVCHGTDGNMKGATVGPRVGAIPLAGIYAPDPAHGGAPRYTDGLLFTKIRYGKPVMPAYPQIPATDRWHVVNYLKTLIKGG